MARHEFSYKGRNVVIATTLREKGYYGFGATIDGESANRGAYDGAETEQQALDDGVAWAQKHIDTLG